LFKGRALTSVDIALDRDTRTWRRTFRRQAPPATFRQASPSASKRMLNDCH
jgi:hypothetical protein